MIESEYSNEYCDRCADKREFILHSEKLRSFENDLAREKIGKLESRLRSSARANIFFGFLFLIQFVFLLMWSASANAQETSCARAKLTWEPPTTRQNGDVLTIEELDYYTIQVVDMSSGEVTTSTVNVEDYIYIEDRPYVRDVNDKPITEYWYTTKPDDEHLREGEQCFRIKVKDTDGLESVWSDYACKSMCSWSGGVDLKIRVGISENN